jgi:hypothetical protein
MTQRTPGNHYTKQNNQRCKYVAVAKAGGRPWTLSFRNTGLFLLKRSHYVFTVSAAQAFLPAECEWENVQRGEWDGSSLEVAMHKTNRFTLGVAVTPTTSFISIITIFAFFFLFVHVFLDFFVHLHFVALLSVSSPAVNKRGWSYQDAQHTEGE